MEPGPTRRPPLPRHQRGAPTGNQNARKHGFYARKQPPAEAQSELTQHRGPFALALDATDLTDEIKALRVLVDAELAQSEPDLARIAIGMQLIIRAVSANYRMSARSQETLTQALAKVVEELGGQMGLGGDR